MLSYRSLSTELWREIVEQLDEGVIVFSQRGVAIYANDEAARLLGYQPRDVLELEKDDLVSLCDPDRMDGARFAEVFLANPMPTAEAGRQYEIVTTHRRLLVTPLLLSLEFGSVTVLFLRDLTSWRSDLIAQTVATEMQGPLAVIGHYSEMLINRLKDGTAHPFELKDLARIIQESLGRAMALWEMLSRLHSVDPKETTVTLAFGRVDIGAVLRSALAQVEQQATQTLPRMHLDAPEDLPPVRAAHQILHYAISILVMQAVIRIPTEGKLTIEASSHERYVQIDLKSEPEGSAVPTHLFDAFPLANVEQTILRHGGRVWTDSRGKRLSISLPVWDESAPSD